MKSHRTIFCLVRHVYHVWRGGQLRFRLETFGLYYPALPYQAPWWRVRPSILLLLCRRMGSYMRWVAEMETLRADGPAGWWSRRRRTNGGPAHDR